MNAKLNRQIDQATTKVEKKAKTFKRKAKRSAGKYAVGIGTVLGLVLAMFALNGLNSFYAKYELYFRSPLQNPLVFHEKILPLPTKMITPTSTPTPSPTKKPTTGTTGGEKAKLVAESKYPEWIEHIWLRESGRGTNTTGLAGYCLSKGMSNEMGFFPRGKHCFNTFAESVARLERWREETAKGMSDNMAKCYYNMGKKVETCAYLGNDYLSMN